MNETEIRERLRKAVGDADYPPSLNHRIASQLAEPVREERSRTPRMLVLIAAVLAVLIVAALVYVGRSQNLRQPVPGVPGPSPTVSPSARPTPTPQPAAGLWPRATNLAYDTTRGQIVLFGGLGSTGPARGDTWVWDGRSWLVKRPVANPPARYGAAIIDDPDRHVVLMFGGRDAGGYRGDMWLWDGSNWTQVQPAHSPSPREGAAVTYDPVHHMVVLFGGSAGGNETWTWDGSDWRQLTPAASPPSRQYAWFAFDAARGNAVLFGAFDGRNDTWTWDGTTWTQRQPPNTPPTAGEATPGPHQMVYDPIHRVIVFVNLTWHSSRSADSTMDTWIWDGTTWTRLTPHDSPTVRSNFGMAFDAVHGMTVLAGGWLVDVFEATSTWSWDGGNWAKVG